jgi:hypothetical protein
MTPPNYGRSDSMPGSSLTRRRAALLLCALFGLFVVVGCSGTRTTELRPEVVAQDCTSESDGSSAIYCIGLETMGAACLGYGGEIVPANSLKFLSPPIEAVPLGGWADGYSPGSGILPCSEWVSTYSRAYVRFDLFQLAGPVERVDFAALKWTTTRVEGFSYEPAKACIKGLYEATGPWQRGKTPEVLLYANLDTAAVNAGYFGVVELVKKWIAHPEQNYGFVIEPARADTMEESNWDCLDALHDLTLVVTYRSTAP